MNRFTLSFLIGVFTFTTSPTFSMNAEDSSASKFPPVKNVELEIVYKNKIRKDSTFAPSLYDSATFEILHNSVRGSSTSASTVQSLGKVTLNTQELPVLHYPQESEPDYGLKIEKRDTQYINVAVTGLNPKGFFLKKEDNQLPLRSYKDVKVEPCEYKPKEGLVKAGEGTAELDNPKFRICVEACSFTVKATGTILAAYYTISEQ